LLQKVERNRLITPPLAFFMDYHGIRWESMGKNGFSSTILSTPLISYGKSVTEEWVISCTHKAIPSSVGHNEK
jgi:hypothetical protein